MSSVLFTCVPEDTGAKSVLSERWPSTMGGKKNFVFFRRYLPECFLFAVGLEPVTSASMVSLIYKAGLEIFGGNSGYHAQDLFSLCTGVQLENSIMLNFCFNLVSTLTAQKYHPLFLVPNCHPGEKTSYSKLWLENVFKWLSKVHNFKIARAKAKCCDIWQEKKVHSNKTLFSYTQ